MSKAGVFLGASAVLLVVGTALFSPRVAVMVAAVCIGIVGLANLEVGDR